MSEPEYNDSYATCARTYITLCVYPDGDPEEVTRRLGLTPSREQRKGDVRHGVPCRLHGWFLRSEGHVESRDCRRHLDWLLDRVEPSAAALREMLSEGCRITLSCYWLSATGPGGPMLDPFQLRRLAALGVGIGFDCYFGEQ